MEPKGRLLWTNASTMNLFLWSTLTPLLMLILLFPFLMGVTWGYSVIFIPCTLALWLHFTKVLINSMKSPSTLEVYENGLHVKWHGTEKTGVLNDIIHSIKDPLPHYDPTFIPFTAIRSVRFIESVISKEMVVPLLAHIEHMDGTLLVNCSHDTFIDSDKRKIRAQLGILLRENGIDTI